LFYLLPHYIIMLSQIFAAAGLLVAVNAGVIPQARDQNQTISQGSGFGTYYYDVTDVNACGTSFADQNLGVVRCSPQAGETLDAINSNYIVAMNNTLLGEDLDKYCGKKVVVSVDGVASDLPLFIGDGCQRCGTGSATATTWDSTGAPGLDFSYTVLNQLTGGQACDDGHASITWEIVDETIHQF
jgi:hypothetical protein